MCITFRSCAVGVGCMESHPGEHYCQIFQEVLHSNALDRSEDDILWMDDVTGLTARITIQL
jgi:hypothetical protein